MNIKDLNITELKALAYDHILNIERSKQSLSVIDQEIDRKERLVKEQIEHKTNSGTAD